MDRIDNYYSATVNDEARYPSLQDSIETDIAIVGGGFTGVATAIELAQRGYVVALCESNQIGWGATGRNGGQVTGSLSGDEAMLAQLKRQAGVEAESFVWNLRWRGHQIIKERIARYNIECDLKHGHLLTAWKPSSTDLLQRLVDQAHENGMQGEVSWLSKSELDEYLDTPLYHGAVMNLRNMHLHSLNLCLGEARAAASLGVKVYEQTQVLNISKGEQPELLTASGRIKAKKVILAGNAYHQLEQKNLRGLLFPAVLGNMATVPLDEELARKINPKNMAVYDDRMVLDYYRLTADNRLMFGSGTNYSGMGIPNVEKHLSPAMHKIFPTLVDTKIEYAWTGTAGIVMNRIPLIGQIDKNIYYAQGYSGHGIASSHVIAEILAEAVSGTMEQFDVFASFKHTPIPGTRLMGNGMLALGMWYYQLKERLR